MWQVIGHSKATALLERSVESRRASHAYLFVGPEHVGKTTTAFRLAQALNCEKESVPCGECRQCTRIESGIHADVQLVRRLLDNNSNQKRDIGIGQIKELQQAAALQPFEGRHRVFIIEEAEHLNEESANCLLKTLEEPPSNVTIVLLTTNEADLLPTVASRCHRIEFRPAPVVEVESALTGQLSIPREQARLVSRLSQGRVGWALSACRDAELMRERLSRLEEVAELRDAGRDKQFGYAARLAASFTKSRDTVEETLRLWLEWWRDLMLVKAGCSHLITNVGYEDTLREQSGCYELSQITGFARAIISALSQLAQNANPRLVLEVLMLSIPTARRPASPAGLRAANEELE